MILLNHFKADFSFTDFYEEFRGSVLIENEPTFQSPQIFSETYFSAFDIAVFKLCSCLWAAVQSQQDFQYSSIFNYGLPYQTNIALKWLFKRKNCETGKENKRRMIWSMRKVHWCKQMKDKVENIKTKREFKCCFQNRSLLKVQVQQQKNSISNS